MFRKIISPLLLMLAALLAIALCASAQSDAGGRLPRYKDIIHLVKPGETLQTISQHYFGTTRRWPQIFKLNRAQLSSPEDVEPGMKLRVATSNPSSRNSAGNHGDIFSPAAAARAAAQQAASRAEIKKLPDSEGPGALVEIQVRPGDTLESIAEQHMGSRKFWSRVMQLNSRKLHDPEDLSPGMTIVVQEFEPHPAQAAVAVKSADRYPATDTTETIEISAAATSPAQAPAAVVAGSSAAPVAPIAAPLGLPHFEDFVDP